MITDTLCQLRARAQHLAATVASEVLQSDLADDGKLNNHAAHEATFARIAAIALRGVLYAQRAQQ